jgi:ATP-dependent helicase IRC3
MTIKLRNYQEECIESVRSCWREGHKRVLVSMPTGCGKTWVFVFVIYMARENGLRSIILVNTDQLVSQTIEKLAIVGVKAGIIKAQKNEWTNDVVVASIQTISKLGRLHNIPPNHFGLVITDECHYGNSESYQRVLWYFQDAWHLGVTATPFRGDKKSLAGAGWDTVAYVYPIKKAIEDDWLAPVVFQRVDTKLQLDEIKLAKTENDFSAKELEKIINIPERNMKIVDAALKHLVVRDGPYRTFFRRTLVFCAGVSHTVDLANAFRKRGIETFAIYGSMKEKHRRLIVQGHKKGAYPVLCNCNILTHGYDDPLISGLIMARPTQSKVLYMQCLGRGLRVAPGTSKKDCVVLDVADVSSKHTITIGKELVELEESIDAKHHKGVSHGQEVVGGGS